MSRTKESTVVVSPVEAHVFFNGNSGKLGMPVENEQNMADLPTPFSFIVLDDGAFRIGGETRGGGVKRKITSNLAHRDYNKMLTVAYKDNGVLIASGEWSQIGQSVKDLGGKYTAVLYTLAKIDGQYKITSLNLRGRALSEWYKFIKGKNPLGAFAYQVTDVVKTDGEEIDSFIPVFKELAASEKSIEEAATADVILQQWLSATFAGGLEMAQAKQQPDRSADAYQEPQPDPISDLPF